MNTLRMIKGEVKSGSKVMFQGDFRKELQKTLDMLEEFLEKNLGNYFQVDSILAGNNNLKIRIDDEASGMQGIVNCILRYHHDEERYGFINIELVSSELSKKPKLHFVGRFGVRDREKINTSVLEDLVVCIKNV